MRTTLALALIVLSASISLGQKPTSHGVQPVAAAVGKPLAAGQSLTIVVPDKGDYAVRTLKTEGGELLELPHEFSDAKTTIKLPAKFDKNSRIAIDDLKTGNTAILPAPTKDTIELHKLDFDHVRQVELRFTFENKPVKLAEVDLTAKDKKGRHKTLDSTAKGVATFEDVPMGNAIMSVQYGENKSETKTLDITSDHAPGALIIPTPLTNKVATLDVPAEPAAGSAGAAGGATGQTPSQQQVPGIQPTAPADNGNPLQSLVGFLIGVAVVGGVIYLLFRWSQSGGMAATLKKIGVEVAGPVAPSDAGTPWQKNAPPPPVVSDPSLCSFCGQKKDQAGNCACTLSGAMLATGPSSPAIPIQPRLVGTMGIYSGTIFPLAPNGSGVSLGRETTNTIPLPNDTTVSRRHAVIRVESGSYMLCDEGSSNGVFVNGAKITGAQALRPGDELQIGNTRFRFEV